MPRAAVGRIIRTGVKNTRWAIEPAYGNFNSCFDIQWPSIQNYSSTLIPNDIDVQSNDLIEVLWEIKDYRFVCVLAKGYREKGEGEEVTKTMADQLAYRIVGKTKSDRGVDRVYKNFKRETDKPKETNQAKIVEFRQK